MNLELIIRNFLTPEKKLRAIPSKRKIKLYTLFYLASKIEPGKTYTEGGINAAINEWTEFTDPATLRRELYDCGFLDREPDGSIYTLASVQPTYADLGLESPEQ